MTASDAQRFGPYVILDRIGDGGMAEIFLAKMQGYSGFEKLIALKKIHPRYSENHTFAQMLIHEAKLAAALTHFNVVQVHDLGEIDRQVYIAMEYVRGRDLAAVLSNTYRRGERLPLELALFIGTEFMTGLEYAHRMRASDGTPLGIIHRDISPQNVLISFEGEVKVTDFGIARIISEKTGFQLPGNMHGKFGYMSPEQAENREIDQRSDVFSAGVVLWEMLVGTRLFRGRDQHETVAMVLSKEIPPPSTLNPEVPPSVDRICTKALARDRDQRYQTMGALLGELSRVADAQPRRAGSRDLSVYMRRQFGTPSGGFRPGRSHRADGSGVSRHSGFHPEPRIPTEGTADEPERVPLGQILLQQGAINMGQLEIGLAEQRAQGGRIGEVLVSTATISDVELAQALAAQANLPSISTADLVALPPPTNLLARFPRDAAETSCILPVSADPADRTVRLAVSDPYDERGVLEAKVVLGVNDVALLVAPRSAIREALSSWYSPVVDLEPSTSEPLFEEGPTEEVELEDEPEPRVLIADADVELAKAVADRIQAEGWGVDVVHDGKAARAILREHPPAVAYLDAALPGIDGYNLLLEIRSASLDTAVFITSERGDEFRQAKALELGADDFLVKPLALEVAASKIRREMRKRSEGRARPPPVRFSGVSGSLEDMTVVDIVQSLELGRKTAHVVIQYEDGRQGLLRVDGGELKGARTEGLEGAQAFYFIAQPGPGLFRIEYRLSSVEANVEEPNTFLMIEAMRHLDEGTAPEPEIATQPLETSEMEPPRAGPEPSSQAELATAPFRREDADWDTTSEHAVPEEARVVRVVRGRPQTPSLADETGFEGAGIEPIPLNTPLGLADDLVLDESSAEAASARDLEAWVSQELESAPRSYEGSPEGEVGPDGTEVARIHLRRVLKPD